MSFLVSFVRGDAQSKQQPAARTSRHLERSKGDKIPTLRRERRFSPRVGGPGQKKLHYASTDLFERGETSAVALGSPKE